MNEKLDEVWLSGDNVSVPLRIRRARAPAVGAKGRMNTIVEVLVLMVMAGSA